MEYLKPNIPKEVTNYLNKYFIPGWKIEHNLKNKIKAAIVVPAISEYDNIRKLLLSLNQMDNEYFDKAIVVFIINNTISSSASVKKDNAESTELLRKIINNENVKDDLEHFVNASGMNIGLVDASSAPLPDKDGGVGLARKIGMDLTLSLFDYNSPEKNILICLDADCTVEKNYLSIIYEKFHQHQKSAVVVNFRHILEGNEEQQFAIICYEIFLRYYVLGLKYAGSNYAFHTIGSAMACDHLSYIKSEGMNKRQAAEDFYFLEKLAKNFEIHQIHTTTVYPSSRPSWRVPFGTGQRVNRYLSHLNNEYLLYSPDSFGILKEWLKLFNSPEISDGHTVMLKAQQIHKELFNFLKDQKFEESWKGILKNIKTQEQLQRQKNYWFDGFRTLKLIHRLRDTAFPLKNMFDAADEMLKRFDFEYNIEVSAADSEIPSIETQRKYLDALRMLV